MHRSVILAHLFKLAVDRDIQKEIVKLGLGEVFDRRTSDAWLLRCRWKRLWCLRNMGTTAPAYFWNVTDPTDIKKIDSIQVDARIVNEESFKRWKITCYFKRGIFKRKKMNHTIDVTDPSNAEIISEYTTNLTGGVHNIFIYENHVYALNAFANPAKYYVINIEDPKNPKEVDFEVDETLVLTYA